MKGEIVRPSRALACPIPWPEPTRAAYPGLKLASESLGRASGSASQSRGQWMAMFERRQARARRPRRTPRRTLGAPPVRPCSIRSVTEPTTEPTTDRANRPIGTQSIESIQDDFRARNYIADRSLATAVFLALELGRPLLLEGEAGVGKTELAKVLASSLGTRLIRLQCYEGLDVNTAVYEWNYPRQMLEIRLLEARGAAHGATAHDIFGPEFLIRRPLLQALESKDGVAPVLLIDEIDRADEEFEAYLLEILSDFQVTVPEIGT